jgi:hypothetical protein
MNALNSKQTQNAIRSEVAAFQLRAEDVLIAEEIRKPAENSDETLNGCHVTPWF